MGRFKDIAIDIANQEIDETGVVEGYPYASQGKAKITRSNDMKYNVTVVLSIYEIIKVEAAASIKEAEQIAWKQFDPAQLLTDYARGEGYFPIECEIYDTKEG